MTPLGGELVTETFDYDGGRPVTVYVPPTPPEVLLVAGDGQVIPPWGETIAAAGGPATMIVGAHRAEDETLRLDEYSPGFDPTRFAAHEAFLLDEALGWARSRFSVEVATSRTAVYGVSAGGELALALGVRHRDAFGAILCASPGAGFHPPDPLPPDVPPTYLVAGTEEPFFHENASRWATALGEAAVEVVMTERPGGHGDRFWQDELPAMVAWVMNRGR